jgi:hypothetical protein
MPDQYSVVTRLLQEMGLAGKWRVVEPVPGGRREMVWIQNKTERLNAYIEIAPQDSELLRDDDELLRRIRVAMAQAEKA